VLGEGKERKEKVERWEGGGIYTWDLRAKREVKVSD
jgi:hypothetical protein